MPPKDALIERRYKIVQQSPSEKWERLPEHVRQIATLLQRISDPVTAAVTLAACIQERHLIGQSIYINFVQEVNRMRSKKMTSVASGGGPELDLVLALERVFKAGKHLQVGYDNACGNLSSSGYCYESTSSVGLANANDGSTHRPSFTPTMEATRVATSAVLVHDDSNNGSVVCVENDEESAQISTATSRMAYVASEKGRAHDAFWSHLLEHLQLHALARRVVPTRGRKKIFRIQALNEPVNPVVLKKHATSSSALCARMAHAFLYPNGGDCARRHSNGGSSSKKSSSSKRRKRYHDCRVYIAICPDNPAFVWVQFHLGRPFDPEAEATVAATSAAVITVVLQPESALVAVSTSGSSGSSSIKARELDDIVSALEQSVTTHQGSKFIGKANDSKSFEQLGSSTDPYDLLRRAEQINTQAAVKDLASCAKSGHAQCPTQELQASATKSHGLCLSTWPARTPPPGRKESLNASASSKNNQSVRRGKRSREDDEQVDKVRATKDFTHSCQSKSVH